MHIGDEANAVAALERFGYYRLSGYFYPLRRTKPAGQSGRLDAFVEGASLELVVRLADFDKQLRLLALYALETIEVSVRVSVAHHLGRLKADAHQHPSLLDGRFTAPGRNGGASGYAVWVQRFEQLCAKSKEDFITHHHDAYGGQMPIWVAIEAWDFGLLSRFFSGLKYRDKNAVAIKYGLMDGEVLKSWIRTFNFVRNVAAHHARLWNRVSTEIPSLPSIERCRHLAPLHQDGEARRRMFGALTLMRFMLRTIVPASDWHERLKVHVQSFPKTDLISLDAAGFPQAWDELEIWR